MQNEIRLSAERVFDDPDGNFVMELETTRKWSFGFFDGPVGAFSKSIDLRLENGYKNTAPPKKQIKPQGGSDVGTQPENILVVDQTKVVSPIDQEEGNDEVKENFEKSIMNEEQKCNHPSLISQTIV